MDKRANLFGRGRKKAVSLGKQIGAEGKSGYSDFQGGKKFVHGTGIKMHVFSYIDKFTIERGNKKGKKEQNSTQDGEKDQAYRKNMRHSALLEEIQKRLENKIENI
jgi:hypothetical protein